MMCTVDGPDFQESGPLLFRPGLRRRRAEQSKRAEVLAATFKEACEGAGLYRSSHSAAGMPVVVTPQVTHIEFGSDSTWMMVKLAGAQVAADVQDVADRLAECLGVDRIGIEPRRRGRWVRIILNPPDPLASSVARPEPLSSAYDPVTFGQLESGRYLRRSLVDSTHLVVQGTTGSGKSVFTYNLLSQLAGVSDVLVAGSDPSGLLLQPWANGEPGWHALGTRSLEMHAVVLERLVATMDERIANFPPGVDKVEITDDTPLIVGALEEFPGLLREAQRHDDALGSNQRAKRLVPRIKGAYGRLLAEGRKAGIRLLIIAQRADADILGGYERGQARLRFSFSVDTPDALKMLHPASATDRIEDHMVAEAGIALVTAPGIKIDRMRAPDNYPFADYCAHVQAAQTPVPDTADDLDSVQT